MAEEGKPVASKVEQQNITLCINISELQLLNLTLSYNKLNCSKLVCVTAIPPKTDVNFYCSHSGQNIRDSCTSQRCRGQCGNFCQKKLRPLANGCTTWWGGSGKGLARALDLIFSLSAPGCALPAKLLFYYHKGCIHLNWKKYVGRDSRPDSCAKTRDSSTHLSELCLLAYWI